jgi:hypothetical protein
MVTLASAFQTDGLSAGTDTNVQVPDPSRTTIQHHLLRSRQLAGPSAYIFAIYNGHGIQEAPTSAGELWSFDVSFEECQVHGTQPSEYIPLLLFDILSCAGASSLFVWDVKNAGRLVEMAKQESAEIDRQLTVAAQSNPEVALALPAVYSKNQIHFAACQPDQVLPKYPAGLPDDLFTACILEPLRIALLFHNLEIAPMGTLDAQASRSPVFMDTLWGIMSDKLKGRLSRELHAVLCTIAWKTLNSKTYAQLFAQGGVVSKASAGFILAQRVMGAYGVQPTSMPTIPSGLSHPLWTTWDLCLSTFFEQLPLQLVEDDNWQDDLGLLSFLSDQLQSVITINQGEGQHQRSIAQEGALSRLPIILEAAHVGSLKQQACRALDACLNTLDANGLRHAIRCGVLQMAMNILSSEENGQEMDTQQQGYVVISIWASLIQNEEAIRHLSAPALKADYLSEAREISFFLQHLKSGLTTSDLTSASIGVKQTIQCAAILSTIISSLPPREAPALLQAMLELALQMLGHGMPLMQEWGCLLTGQLLKSLRVGDSSLIQALVLQAKEDLLGLIEDRRVETRAAALDALQCWFKRDTVGKGKEPELRLLKALLPRVTAEAAVQTRLQLTNLLCTALFAEPVLSRVAVMTLRAQELVKDSPEAERQAVELSSSLSRAVEMDKDKFEKVTLLIRAVQAVELYCEDSHAKVAERARGIMRRLACEYEPAGRDGGGDHAAVRGLAWLQSYFEETVRLRQQAPEALKQGQAEQACPPSQLFRSSKDLLRAYLPVSLFSSRRSLDPDDRV